MAKRRSRGVISGYPSGARSNLMPDLLRRGRRVVGFTPHQPHHVRFVAHQVRTTRNQACIGLARARSGPPRVRIACDLAGCGPFHARVGSNYGCCRPDQPCIAPDRATINAARCGASRHTSAFDANMSAPDLPPSASKAAVSVVALHERAPFVITSEQRRNTTAAEPPMPVSPPTTTAPTPPPFAPTPSTGAPTPPPSAPTLPTVAPAPPPSAPTPPTSASRPRMSGSGPPTPMSRPHTPASKSLTPEFGHLWRVEGA